MAVQFLDWTCLFQVHKTHVGQTSTHIYLEDKDMFQSVATRTESEVWLPDGLSSPVHWHGPSREAELCDPAVTGVHPFLIQRHNSRSAANVAGVSQQRQHHNIQRLKVIRGNLNHTEGPATKDFFNYISDLKSGCS